MKKTTFFVLLLFLFSNTYGQSPLKDLFAKLDDLEDQVNYDKKRISDLQDQIRIVTNQNRSLRTEADDLKKSVQAKTAEIFELRTDLKNKLSTIQNLLDQIEFLNDKSQGQENAIKRLTLMRDSLTSDLDYTNQIVKHLSDSLQNAKKDYGILELKSRELENTIKNLLDVQQYMSFLELSFSSPGGYQASFSTGKIGYGNSTFFGIGLSYLLVQRTNIFESEGKNISNSLLPVSAELRFPLGKKRLGFHFVDPFKPLPERVNLYGLAKFGYAPMITKPLESDYNRGGLNGFLGVYAAFSPFETVNATISIGIDVQHISFKNSMQQLMYEDILYGFHFGFGANFYSKKANTFSNR